jgi:epoxyqueuosine reductase
MSARSHITTAQIIELGVSLGIDALGVCEAAPYSSTESAIKERAERGLFADLKFTMAQPERSCHPELLVPDARSVISAALSYWFPEPDADERRGPTGRIARYTRADAYELLAQRLEMVADELREAGYEARVLVDSNHHVDREAARRSGVGFYGKHTNIITRRHGSWVVLGTIATSATLEPTMPVRPGCGSCTACIDACPTDAIIEPGVLDTRSCITYWTQSRHSIPHNIRESMGDMVYGCDICQDVCPWNRGVERRKGMFAPQSGRVALAEWLGATDDELNERYMRFFVPRRQMRFLRRNALVALGNSGDQRSAALIVPWLSDEDPMLREHAQWALRTLGGPIAEAALAAASDQ